VSGEWRGRERVLGEGEELRRREEERGREGEKRKWSKIIFTVKPLITDPPRSGQPLYSGRLTCPRLILP